MNLYIYIYIWGLNLLHDISKHARKTYITWKVLYANQPTPNKKSIWIKELAFLIHPSVSSSVSMSM